VSDSPKVLEGLAGAVADGEAVDWDLVDSHGLIGPARYLKAISLLAARPDPTHSSTYRDSRESLAGAPLGLPFWLAGIVALAASQVLVACAALGSPAPDSQAVPSLPLLVNMGAFTVAGAALLTGGRRDRRAIYLGAVFITVASALGVRFAGRLGPEPSLLTWWRGSYADAFLPLLMWLFVRDFPRLGYFTRYDGFARKAIVVSGAMAVLLFSSNVARPFAGGSLSRLLAVMSRNDRPSIYWVSLFVLMLPAFPVAVGRTRLAGESERRRARLFAMALAVGSAPIFLEVLAEITFPSFRAWMSTAGHRYVGAFVLYGFIALIPFFSAYSVLVHRVLDVRIILARAMQYMLARYTLWALTAAPFAALAAYVAAHRNERVGDLITSRTAIAMIAIAVTGFVAIQSRRGLRRLLDHAFMRVRVDPHDALASFASHVRDAESMTEIVTLLAETVDRALGVEQVFVLTLSSTKDRFVPSYGACRPLPAESAIAAILRSNRSPLNVHASDRRSLFRLLPEEDRLWALDVGCSVIVPINAPESSAFSVLVLGPRRVGVGFTFEDRGFIANMAGAAELALENRSMRHLAPSAPIAADEPAAECRRCGQVQDWAAGRCQACGGDLVPAVLPLELLGKFKVHGVLGRGGMGVVYLATDLVLGRRIALKTLPRLSAQAAGRLKREARAMAAVVHPNLAVIHGSESWRGTPILIVEYLDGGTLAKRLSGGRLPIAEVLSLGVTLAGVLDRVHHAGILHRDVKPSNIGYTNDGSLKLLDFGLAQLLDDVGSPAVERAAWLLAPAVEPLEARVDSSTFGWQGRSYLAGTPLYLSPEAMLRREPSPSFDLWSLGVVLYEATAGVHPFKGASIGEIFTLIDRSDAQTLRRRLDGCPDDVAAFLCRMLARDRRQRPASAAAVAQGLDALRSMVA
jgi:tRNA A-37 threonylcarbamoyl transferase component Bud32